MALTHDDDKWLKLYSLAGNYAYTPGELVPLDLWPRYDRHFVGRYDQWCIGGYTRVYAVYQPPGFLTAYTHLSDHK